MHGSPGGVPHPHCIAALPLPPNPPTHNGFHNNIYCVARRSAIDACHGVPWVSALLMGMSSTAPSTTAATNHNKRQRKCTVKNRVLGETLACVLGATWHTGCTPQHVHPRGSEFTGAHADTAMLTRFQAPPWLCEKPLCS